MSWGITSIGPPEAVVDEVNKNTGMPESLKQVVREVAGQLAGKDVFLSVESSGHIDFTASAPFGPRGSGTLSFKFQPPAKLPQG